MPGAQIPLDRRCIPIEEWPDQDVDLWHRMTKPAGPLDKTGVGSNWRETTEIGRRRFYGRWLTFLCLQDPDALALLPAERVTESRVKKYITLLDVQGLKPITIHGYVLILWMVLRQEGLQSQAVWFGPLIANLEALILEDGVRPPPLFSQKDMLNRAMHYMENCCAKAPHLALDVHVRFRDGLMIALQTARALRPRNLAMIDVGRHLIKGSHGFKLEFTANEIKTGQPYASLIPAVLNPYMQQYLERHRPALLQKRENEGLWISNRGAKMNQGSMFQRFKILTKRLIGKEINPHAFRHGAATYVATEFPQIVSSTPAILHHSNSLTAEKHYTMANTVAAGRRYQEALKSVSKRNLR